MICTWLGTALNFIHWISTCIFTTHIQIISPCSVCSQPACYIQAAEKLRGAWGKTFPGSHYGVINVKREKRCFTGRSYFADLRMTFRVGVELGVWLGYRARIRVIVGVWNRFSVSKTLCYVLSLWGQRNNLFLFYRTLSGTNATKIYILSQAILYQGPSLLWGSLLGWRPGGKCPLACPLSLGGHVFKHAKDVLELQRPRRFDEDCLRLLVHIIQSHVERIWLIENKLQIAK
jgi:hypothetical protein